MPFIALNSVSGERVDITRTTNPLAELRASEMVCPVCQWPMIVKSGTVVRSHFAHKTGREDCPYAEYQRGETPEHLDAKMMIRDELANWFAEYAIAEPALEVYVPNVQHARNRIADVLFTFPNGWRVAHEIQLAAITTSELRERTEDYLSVGIDSYWWLGRDAATPINYGWSMKNYGFVLEVQLQAEQENYEHVLLSSARPTVRENFSPEIQSSSNGKASIRNP